MSYNTAKIAEGVWCIVDGTVQCFLIEGSEKALLLDCCLSGGTEFKRVVDALTDKPVMLVLSHSDPDHTGGQQYFQPAYMHPAEYCRYADKGNGLDGVLPLWEGTRIDLGDTTLEVILVPGHTPGSIALLDRAHRRLFIGDTVSDAWIYMFGDGRSVPALIESLEKLETLVPLIHDIHPSHGSPTLDIEWIRKTKVAAQKMLAGEIPDTDPPRSLPCRNYSHEGVNLYYQP